MIYTCILRATRTPAVHKFLYQPDVIEIKEKVKGYLLLWYMVFQLGKVLPSVIVENYGGHNCVYTIY